MRIDNTTDRKKKKKKKSSDQKKSNLESMVFSIMEKSLKSALDACLDDLFREWK